METYDSCGGKESCPSSELNTNFFEATNDSGSTTEIGQEDNKAPKIEALGIDAVRSSIEQVFVEPSCGETETDLVFAASTPTVNDGKTEIDLSGSFGQKLNRGINRFYDVWKEERSISLRPATEADIERMVEIDLLAFKSVYKHYESSPEDLKKELFEKFSQRFNKIGSKWITLLEKSDKTIGFLMACPTSKLPEDFTSWETNTDNGTLETAYDPQGKYVFVVSLSVLGEGSKFGGQNMLGWEIISKIIAGDYQGYFESRVPGLKRWVLYRCQQENIDFSDLTIEQERKYADEYFENNVIKGNYTDPLLKFYHRMGCEFVKIIPNAYQDELSLNYGVVTTIESFLPRYLQRLPWVRKLTGKALSLIGHSRWLTEKWG